MPILRLFLRWPRLAFAIATVFVIGCVHLPQASRPGLPVRVALFRCDVTPPLGHPLCGGWIKSLEAVDDPLLAKGIVIDDGANRYVLCAVDWCLLQTGAYDLFRHKLAEATGAPERNVSVHTVHQHNAPIADINAQYYLSSAPGAPTSLALNFTTNVTDRVAAAARASLANFQTITAVGFGQAQVEKVASSRRVRLADGKIHVRYSSTKDPELIAAAEGLIDPWLRTVSLYQSSKPIARLHFYATHPMSYYGDGRATSDTVGLAREQLEREEGIPEIYFTGCGGNITPGKYNDGSPQSRVELTGRLHTAMQRSVASTVQLPLSALRWSTTDVTFAVRPEPEWTADASRKVLTSTNAPKAARANAAFNLAWIDRIQRDPRVQLSSLQLGPVTLLFLPGEAFIEYQLYAHSLRPSQYLAVAAYGEAGMGYICCDESLHEGGYEPTDSRAGPPTEWALKAGINTLLEGSEDQHAIPFYPDKLHLLSWRDPLGHEVPITRTPEWIKRRRQILGAMQEVMGPLPPPATSPPPVTILETFRGDGFTRQKLLIEVEPGNELPAYLFIPKNLRGRAPAMLCLHQTTPTGKSEPAGLTGLADLHYALELAQRGYITLAPDYPNFGDYHRDSYAAGFRSATMQGIVNYRRAVDFLESMKEVDPHSMGVIGHSLGGHNALFLAAFDPRLRAVITSCGFNSFFKYYYGDLTGWSHRGYMPAIDQEHQRDPRLMPFDFSEVLAAIAPRALYVNAPLEDANFEVSGVHDCLAAARPVYDLLNARDKIMAVHPQAGHSFPAAIRQSAYAWLDLQMSHTPPH